MAFNPVKVFQVLFEKLENTSAADLLSMGQRERQNIVNNILSLAPHTLKDDNPVLLLVFALKHRRAIEDHLMMTEVHVGPEWYENCLCKLLLMLKRDKLGNKVAASFQIFKQWEKLKMKVHEGENITPDDRADEYGGNDEESDSGDESNYENMYSPFNSDDEGDWQADDERTH
jgi:hypothetical protein